MSIDEALFFFVYPKHHLPLLYLYIRFDLVYGTKWQREDVLMISFSYYICVLVQDYLVLLPSAYYEAPILQLKVTEPCIYSATHEPNQKSVASTCKTEHSRTFFHKLICFSFRFKY